MPLAVTKTIYLTEISPSPFVRMLYIYENFQNLYMAIKDINAS